KMQKRIARVEPAERGQNHERIGAQPFAGELQMLAHRQDPLLSNQTIDLHPERNERDQVNHTEGANEEIAAHKVSRPPNFIGPEHARKERAYLPIARNQPIGRFGTEGETRDILVSPNQSATSAPRA